MILYKSAQWTVRTIAAIRRALEIEGLENIPEEGPFLLIANHQSSLDPILIQAICPRPIHTMAKSTQFASPAFAWLMTTLLSFPVKRYQVDPQAVRTVLRTLDRGEPIGIYIEGERSWDGELQRPRLGALRLILKAGVPVIPTGITGSYDAWPRWSRTPKHAKIRISFGEPLHFEAVHDKTKREALLDETGHTIMTAIGEQMNRREPQG